MLRVDGGERFGGDAAKVRHGTAAAVGASVVRAGADTARLEGRRPGRSEVATAAAAGAESAGRAALQIGRAHV